MYINVNMSYISTYLITSNRPHTYLCLCLPFLYSFLLLQSKRGFKEFTKNENKTK